MKSTNYFMVSLRTKTMKIDIPDSIQEALTIIHKKGHEAFIVGGCVRDAFLGLPIKDYDITTNASPMQIIDLFKNYKVIETGIVHGTLTLIIDDQPIEITTYRIDGSYSDHRRPDKVEFTGNLKEDLRRRDFTINALAYNETTGIIDCFGGLIDLQKRLIRSVGDAQDRFEEDALRIIRALRFSSTLGFSIERETAKAIHHNKKLLKRISADRITAEFSKMLCGKDFGKVILTYYELIPQIISGIDGDYKVNIMSLRQIALWIDKLPRVLPLRLAVFLWYLINPNDDHSDEQRDKNEQGAKRILKAMGYDKNTRNKVILLVNHFTIQIHEDERLIKRWMRKLTPSVLKELVLLKRLKLSFSDNNDNEITVLEKADYLIDKILHGKGPYLVKDLAINGGDLLDLGLLPGKRVGEILEYLLNCVIDGSVKNNRKELLDVSRRLIVKSLDIE